jgi:hypothetical protein
VQHGIQELQEGHDQELLQRAGGGGIQVKTTKDSYKVQEQVQKRRLSSKTTHQKMASQVLHAYVPAAVVNVYPLNAKKEREKKEKK